jgi:multicomponent Na+:H+ antiporter subunit E
MRPALSERSRQRHATMLRRALAFLGLWLVLSGAEPADLPAGMIAALVAAWASLRLVPPSRARLAPIAVAGVALHFFRQSVVAGANVAWRAFDPRLPLKPGFVTYPVRFPPGPARSTFAVLTSLLPGTVPAGEENGALVYHCLDVDQPVVSQLAMEEAALSRTLRND